MVIPSDRDGGELAHRHASFDGLVRIPACDGSVGERSAVPVNDIYVFLLFRSPAFNRSTGPDPTDVAVAHRHRGECTGRGLDRLNRVRLASPAPSRHELGVDVVLAAVDVEQRFLVGDEAVAHIDIVLSGDALESAGRGTALRGLTVDTAAGHHMGVHAEQAAVSVQQRLLVGDQPIA